MKDFDNLIKSNVLGQSRVFYELLCSIIHPRNQSDRTCFWKVCLWADNKIRSRAKSQDLLQVVVELAKEANGPDSKNPAAVFMSLLKKELNYPE
jgi:hypothetical protein